MEERLQKIIANSGFCSRRRAEEYIEEGLVKLNDSIAKLGDKADKEKDKIRVDGKLIESGGEKYYYVLNKPKGILVTKSDPDRRKTIYALPALKELKNKLRQNLNYVGRLDALSEGLLLLTNDGELNNKLTHPKHEHRKTYLLRTEPTIKKGDIERAHRGILIDGRKAYAEIRPKKQNEFNMEIKEGRNRIIRRILEEELNYKIYLLKRLQIENIRLGNLETGQVRELTTKEVAELKRRLSQ
jgi:23S rRNA pseudouridine2605 synthase